MNTVHLRHDKFKVSFEIKPQKYELFPKSLGKWIAFHAGETASEHTGNNPKRMGVEINTGKEAIIRTISKTVL